MNQNVRDQKNKTEEIPIEIPLYKNNSASYIFGASVDTSYSSSSDLSGESDLVLLDRPNPPANRAWCSDENEPVLTVNLANYIKPTAVSYQHFKWNGTVPHGSPRVFNVFACIDFNCEKTEPLVTNCEYKSFGEIQEQIYQIPSNSKTKSIGKVQFRFLKNHGNVKKTCVSLVRVYGESTGIPKMREFKTKKISKTCSEFKHIHHHNPFSYDKVKTVSISGQTLKKGTFSIRETTKSREKWFRTHGQMIGIGMIGFMQIILLINSHRISSNVEETRQTFDKLPKMDSRTNTEFQKADSIEKENEKMIEKLNEALKEVKPILMDQESKNEETPTKNSLHTFNAASYMYGASVDTSYSSSSDLSGESDLVLLDRPNPPANRAWCSDENEPVLTVNLANYIKPTAVSYQHFKWNRTVPDGSPRLFNVFACLDFSCEKTELLISNCEYKSSSQIQEQICQIPSNTKTKSIGKVQLRFLKNHGNVKKTCVSLVRVYGESTDLPKIKSVPIREFYNTCSYLRTSYHNYPFIYDKLHRKTCEHLFSNSCCSVCPECCDECYIEDYTDFYQFVVMLGAILAFVSFAFLLAFLCVFAMNGCKLKGLRRNGG
uniref:SUN domain-containing protein n=1 Tax=Caenorhabditis tropicalis TaxID=1561998 RepID=A0A1I7UDA0_9PELO